MSHYGLVLAGGGGKGAYQMGAWKALKEMGIIFDAIAGVSIGSINGALIAQGDFDKAMEMWDGVSIDKGVNITETLPDPENLFSKKNWGALFREVIKKGGLDASPLAEYIKNYIDENKIRESKIPLGIITVQLNQKMNPLELFINDIPEGELIDYLLASSHIPLVTNIGPEGEKYLDGGVYDNTPVMTLKKRGYNKLIVIDISNIKGVAHNLDFSNSQVVYIKPYDSEDLGAAFDFDSELNKKRMQLGYLDTKKAFGELAGNIYHFLPSVFRGMVLIYGADEIYQLELLANKLGVEKGVIYSEETFLQTVKTAYEKQRTELQAKEEAKSKPSENKYTEVKASEVTLIEPEIPLTDNKEEEEIGVFGLSSLKSFFMQKKAEFEETEKDILLAVENSVTNHIEPKIIETTEEKSEKEDDGGHFNLSLFKNYFSQKKTGFEGFEKAIEILDKM